MRIIARIHPGPAWLAGRTVFQQGPIMNEHLAFMRARFDDGTLLVGGPLATEESGFALLEAADLSTARHLVDQDPAAQADVVVYDLQQLLPYFDAISGARAEGAATDQARHTATPADLPPVAPSISDRAVPAHHHGGEPAMPAHTPRYETVDLLSASS